MKLVIISPCQNQTEIYEASNLFVFDMETGLALPLPISVEGGKSDPAWSPDGSQIAFTLFGETNRSEIYLYDIESETEELLIPYDASQAVEARYPFWSPDGTQLAITKVFVDYQQVWIFNVDGSGEEAYSTIDPEKFFSTNARWSLDGSWINFTQTRVSSSSLPTLLLAPASSGNSTISINLEKIPMREGVFSPDSTMIAVEAWATSDGHFIYIMRVDGSEFTALPTDNFSFDVAWRP
jgi:Tol biopolymer transport system component